MSRSYRLLVGGQWLEAADGSRAPIVSPVTGERVADVAVAGPADVDAAVVEAQAAYQKNLTLTAFDRASFVVQISLAVIARTEELADAMVLEQGKTRREALEEIDLVARNFRLAGEDARRGVGETIPTEDPKKRVITFPKPRGVLAAITPWNYPLNLPAQYVAPALASGNAIILKPAPTTAGLAALFAECIADTDTPRGLFSLLTGPSIEMSSALVQHPGVTAVCFTGSSVIGAAVMKLAAGRPTLMELGGNGPTIILDDADIERAVSSLAVSAFGNAGQSCCAPERVLVSDRIRPQVVEALTELANRIELGDPRFERTTLGPVHVEAVAAKMDTHIADALDRGGSVTAGGRRSDGFPTSLYYQPTVIDNVSPDALIHQEETFGPIAPVTGIENDEQMLAVANSCGLGLSAAVYTRDLQRAFWFSERLEVGQVVVNDHADYNEVHLPFGGWDGKRSGHGRVGGKYTFDFMTQLRTIVLDIA